MNNDRVNEAYYGSLSDKATRKVTRKRIHWISSQVIGDRILDLGCSQGITSILLARKHKRVFGMDIEVPALLYARRETCREEPETSRRIHLLLGDGSTLPYPAGVFDSIVLGEVIEHVAAPSALISELRRVLSMGGRLVLTTPFGLLPHEDHKRSLYIGSLLALLEDHFVPEQVGIQGHHYLQVVARPHTKDASAAPVMRPHDLLEMEEEKFLAKEQWYVDQRRRLRSRLDKANDKYRQATAQLLKLKILVEQVADRELSEEEQETLKALNQEAQRQQTEIQQLRTALTASEEACKALEDRYCNAVASFKKLKATTDSLRSKQEGKDPKALDQQRRIDELQAEVQELRETARYKIGDAFVRSFGSLREAIRLPSRLWSIYRSRVSAGGRTGTRTTLQASRASNTEIAHRHLQCRRDFDAFLRYVRKVDPTHFVVMFGGTTYIQDLRANRPIRLTRSLIEQGIPVLFNFHRWRATDHIPSYDPDTPLLFQSPIDLTPELVLEMLSKDMGTARRLFVASYPHPSLVRLVPQVNVNGWATLYDCRDDWEEFAKVGQANWYRESIERYLVSHCDMTCCVSRTLCTKLASYTDSRPVHLLPNAFDPAFLSPGYRHTPRETVTVGYFGHLTASWFDWESLAWIARRRPNWRFQIIGHGAPAPPEELGLPPNVELLGPRRHPEICTIASSWQAAIIPFKIGPLADAVDPIKIYEYFSLGLPVVSFRMPQIADYPYTRTVQTRAEFVDALDEAVEAECEAEVLRQFLSRNTWEIRARQMLDWTDEILGEPNLYKIFQAATGGK